MNEKNITKIIVRKNELHEIIGAMEANEFSRYNGLGADIEMYKRYKENLRLINRLKRAAIRVGSTQNQERPLSFVAWSKQNM